MLDPSLEVQLFGSDVPLAFKFVIDLPLSYLIVKLPDDFGFHELLFLFLSQTPPIQLSVSTEILLSVFDLGKIHGGCRHIDGVKVILKFLHLLYAFVVFVDWLDVLLKVVKCLLKHIICDFLL
jgi:hypothetical protein